MSSKAYRRRTNKKRGRWNIGKTRRTSKRSRRRKITTVKVKMQTKTIK